MTIGSEWQKEFFGPENMIKLEEDIPGGYTQQQARFMARYLNRLRKDCQTIILPRRNMDRKFGYYLAASDPRTMTELQAICRAFIGSSDLEGDLRIRKTAQNGSEAALLKGAPSGFIRVVAKADSFARVQEAVHRLMNVMDSRPLIHRQIRRPVGRILRDFFLACQQGDGVAALACAQEIRSQAGLSPLNLAMLEIRALATGHQWEQILQDPGLELLVRSNLPASVDLALLEAFANTILGPDVIDQTTAHLVRSQCAPFRALFQRTPMAGPESTTLWRAWVTGAAALGIPGLLARLPGVKPDWLDPIFKWAGIESLSASPEPDAPKPSQAQATSLTERLILANAEEIDATLTEFDSLPEAERRAYLSNPRIERLLKDMRQERTGVQLNWDKWFTQMTSATKEQFAELEQLALLESVSWAPEAFSEEHIRGCLSQGWGARAMDALRNVLPVLQEWTRKGRKRVSAGFWIDLLLALALDDGYFCEDLVLAEQLTEAFLSTPHRSEDYSSVIDAVSTIWGKLESLETIREGLDLIELLSLYPSADRGSLDRLAQAMLQFCRNQRERLSPLPRALARELAQDLFGPDATAGLEDPAPPQEATALPDLKEKLLAIYTLTETAGRRAKVYLEKKYSGLKVILNGDLEATDVLGNLAARADFFVFCTLSSKHQAFYQVVECARKRNLPLLYPAGKGMTSLVEAFERALPSPESEPDEG